MKLSLSVLLCLVLCSCTTVNPMNSYKHDVTIWYDAFNKRDPSLLDNLMSEDWVDVPSAPGQPMGREGVKHILPQLATVFPDFQVTIKEILQDGNKVIVRSEITGTQRTMFMGFPAKNRSMAIQAVDIHEFKDGRIVRTWHTEDWMTGLRQLGVFDP